MEKKIKDVKDIIEEISPYYRALKEKKVEDVPDEEHELNFRLATDTLEPAYFWIVDKMNEFFGYGGTEKLRDNFVSTPGSGHFSELMGKASRMHEEVNKIMQTVGLLIKSIVNIIYDLKEFEIRLSQYKAANSKDEKEREAGLLALKQIWMDNVDSKRGAGSINALTTGNLNFVTLRDAFMAAKSIEDVDKMDLNERVKRILKPRLQEFFKWKELSERELRKRYEIEKTYLRNQLNSLKLNTRWARPYLKASFELEQQEKVREPDLVKAFNTIRMELTLLGKGKFNFRQAVFEKNLPAAFRKLAEMDDEKRRRKVRDFYSCVLVDFIFRGLPTRVGQHYIFTGRGQIHFRGYTLNEDELEVLHKRLDESDIKDALEIISGMTDESLKQLEEDISYFLKEEEAREKLSEDEKKEDINPFAALIGLGKKKEAGETKEEESEEKEKEVTKIRPENYIEKLVRNLASKTTKKRCFDLYDIMKKDRGMASHPDPYRWGD